MKDVIHSIGSTEKNFSAEKLDALEATLNDDVLKVIIDFCKAGLPKNINAEGKL